MRIQNLIASAVFALVLTCAAVMQLLSWNPTSPALWYLNLNYAREARPVLELFDYLPFSGFAQNIVLMLSCLILCGLAAFQRSRIMTCLTTHLALYLLVYAGSASFVRSFGNPQSASMLIGDAAIWTGALDSGQQAILVLFVVLILTCLSNHVQIISDMFRHAKRGS